MLWKISRRTSEEQDTMHSIVLFSARSVEVDKMLKDVRGKHKRIANLKFIDRVIGLESSNIRSSVTLLKVASFEDTQMSDSHVFREVGLDLQDYMKYHLDSRIQHSCSAVYLHLDRNTTPGLITQRNLRAVRQLCQMLGLRDLSLFIMSPSSQESSLRSNVLHQPLFRAMEDVNLWQEYLAFQDTEPVNQFLRLFLKHRRGTPYVREDRRLTEDSLSGSFRQVDSDFFAGVQEARAGLVGEANRARDNCQKAEDAARTAEKALHDITLQHNSLLQHLNIRDNTEISDVVHQFQGLNDDIDGFSLEVAQIIRSDYFERYPDCTKCHNPGGLRQFLGQSSDPLLLLQSRAGVPMATRQFLELFTASATCFTLYGNVFWPFYPLSPRDPSAPVRFETLVAVYNDLRLQNQQMASAKWRIETYSSLVKLDSIRDRRVADISAHVAAIINSATTHLFKVEIKSLANRPRLVKLVTRALDLNHILKSEAAHAGDINVECFPFNHEYDESRMEVLDAKKGDTPPKQIVSTFGLGVCLTKAVGGGKEPELTVLLKAVVSSENVYG